MDQKTLFRLALGLQDPWFVADVRFDARKTEEGLIRSGQLHVHLDFNTGARFCCPSCGEGNCEVYDTTSRTWRHLDFFQHEALLHARVPRVTCSGCGVHQVHVPWARPGSGFTLLFEAVIMTLVAEMPVSAVGRQVRVTDTRIWRLLQAYVREALEQQDLSEMTTVAADETASRRGHDYVTLFVDMKQSRVAFVTPGKDQSTFDRFLLELHRRGGRKANITDVVIDMSAAFTAGARECFPDAVLTYDKFHATKLVTEALDDTRREEARSRPELVGTRYVWLKNPLNLTEGQMERWDSLKDADLKTVKAYHLYLAFREIWHHPASRAVLELGRWIGWALRSRVPAMKKAAQTIRKHAAQVLRVIENDLTTALLEGINSLVQAAKARARGYRSVQNFMTMIYLLAGKLDLGLAHTK
jgi:transposase